jgi:hypothetical protein
MTVNGLWHLLRFRRKYIGAAAKHYLDMVPVLDVIIPNRKKSIFAKPQPLKNGVEAFGAIAVKAQLPQSI